MINNMLFSILVPVYNSEQFLGECIESVFSQSFSSWELILVDDGSTDSSGMIVDRYSLLDPRVHAYHKENGGQLHTRQFAAKKAKGEYCIFLDSDDLLDKNALETIAVYLDQSKSDCIVYGFRIFDDNGRIIDMCSDSESVEITGTENNIVKLICNVSYNSMCRKAIKRTILLNSIKDYDYSIRQAEDLQQSIDIYLQLNSVFYISEVLYNYRSNSSSISHTTNVIKQQDDIFKVRSYVLRQLESKCSLSDDSQIKIQKFFSKCFISIIKQLAPAMPYAEYKDILKKYMTTEYFQYITKKRNNRRIMNACHFYLSAMEHQNILLVWILARVEMKINKL